MKHRSCSIFALLIALPAGCGFDGLLNSTASLGGSVAGQRGNAEVLFINNTPFRAIFTFGVYDNLDRDTMPLLQPFSADNNTMNLEGNTQSGVLQVQCGRVFSVGGDGLIARVRENLGTDAFDETALVQGVHFSSADVADDLADQPTEGTAASHDALIGVDFECNALLVYRLEFNDAGPQAFEVQLSVIPSDSTR